MTTEEKKDLEQEIKVQRKPYLIDEKKNNAAAFMSQEENNRYKVAGVEEGKHTNDEDKLSCLEDVSNEGDDEKKEKRKILFKITIQVAPNKQGKITIREGDNLFMIAEKFAIKHKIDKYNTQKVVEVLNKAQEM